MVAWTRQVFTERWATLRPYSTHSKRDPYDVLGVHRSSTAKEIKAAYFELSKKYHPDAGGTAEDAEKFHEVAAAYDQLGDASKRQEYDRKVARVRDMQQQMNEWRSPHARTTNFYDDTYYSQAYPGVSRFARGRRPDIEDVDAQYRSFIAYKERLRQRRERQAYMSHAPPEFWNEFSPGHENKFESVYRSPYHRNIHRAEAERREEERVEEEARASLESSLKKTMPTFDELHRLHRREQEEQRAVMGATFGIALLAVTIIATLGIAMRSTRETTKRNLRKRDSA